MITTGLQQRESALHRELKFRYAAGGSTEIEKEGYICDALDPDGTIIEVQTGHFNSLKKKLPLLTALGPVKLVYPVIVSKTIEVLDVDGNLLSRRTRSQKGSFWELFAQLIHAPILALLPNLTIEVILVDAGERRTAGKGSRRRGQPSVTGRTLVGCREKKMIFSGPGDYRKCLPFKGRQEFTSPLLAEKAGIRKDLAVKVLYVLYHIGVVRRTRKEGRCWIYKIAPARTR